MLTHAQIQSAARGNAQARQELVHAHGPLVFALCRRLCSDPEDAYQDVWSKVFGALERFDTARAGQLRAWIATIARRHLVDRHRRARVRGRSEPPDTLADPGPTPDQLANRAELRTRLEAALMQLPIGQRAAVVGHDVHGSPLAELAADEGVAVGTIKSRLHRGRARLAEILRAASPSGVADDPR